MAAGGHVDGAPDEIGSAANSYQVFAKLATGGMAEIFLARSAGVASVQRYVVLKRVLPERAADITFVKMFLEEARLAAQLQHPNIAQVFDVGKLGDSYFFTMEYVHGETVGALRQRAREAQTWPPLACVLAIAAGAAAGLHHAHQRIGVEGRPLGIVHRDVSPSNLMVSYDGTVKLVDFGVAKAADRIEETRSGAVKGKISYLSPEQARGQKLDRRSDLFSLGIVMWELLTLERLYRRASDFESMTAIIHEPTPPPSSRRGDIPPAVDELVLRALAKSPADRFQTAEELGEAIEQVAAQSGTTLSAGVLSRFVRELFGQRPEPWTTLPVQQHRSEVLTVTTEPVPQQLVVPISDPLALRLAAVADLSVAAPVEDAFTRSLPAIDARGRVAPPARAAAVPANITRTDAESALTSDPPAPARSSPSVPPSRAPWILVMLALILAGVAAIVVVLAFPGEEIVPDPNPAPIVTARAPEIVAPVEPSPAVVIDAVLPADAAVDATELALTPDATPEVDRTGETPSERRPVRPDRKAGLVARFERRQYAEVVRGCTTSKEHDRAMCAVAACHVKDAAKARRWLQLIAATQRARVIKTCAAAGTTLDEPRSRGPDCDADPLACPK